MLFIFHARKKVNAEMEKEKTEFAGFPVNSSFRIHFPPSISTVSKGRKKKLIGSEIVRKI